MRTRYPSKKDWWIVAIVWAVAFGSHYRVGTHYHYGLPLNWAYSGYGFVDFGRDAGSFGCDAIVVQFGTYFGSHGLLLPVLANAAASFMLVFVTAYVIREWRTNAVVAARLRDIERNRPRDAPREKDD